MTHISDAGDDRRDDWGTPDWLFEWAAAIWGPFDIDIAANADNAKCDNWITEEQDALILPWGDGKAWGNPPYSLKENFASAAAARASEIGRCTLLLLPASTEADWFHRYLFDQAAELCFLQGRVPFIGPDGREVSGAAFGSVLAWFAPGAQFRTPSLWWEVTQDIKHGRARKPSNGPRQRKLWERLR